MAEARVIINRPSSANTPPNCAICLGNCTNKCFSNSCMHQFCFQCLLQWSKIKAECPLCKQPFKSIIHNIKSNEDYDEHVVETPLNEDVHLVSEDLWFLPPLIPHRQFHVRTTFTVDSRGESAIQQMLMAHPLTTTGRITVNTSGLAPPRSMHYPRNRRNFSTSTISYRKSIYFQDLWVNPMPDLTGRYRECSSEFYREYPAARGRLVPWLNRELNALLEENTQSIMRLIDFILQNLLTYHICSRTFRNLLREHLGSKTDHFVHEFYSYMRSPYDMVGYDRNIIYTPRPVSPAPFIDDTVEIADNSDDSDVVLISESTPAEPVTINLIESNSDSDELIMMTPNNNQVPLPLPPPISSSHSPPFPETTLRATLAASPLSPDLLPIINLPAKLRYKQQSSEDKDLIKLYKRKRRRIENRANSSSSSDEETWNMRESCRKFKRLKKSVNHCSKKGRCFQRIDSGSEDFSSHQYQTNLTTDSDDNKPLSHILNEIKSKRKTRRRIASFTRTRDDDSTWSEDSPQISPIDLSTSNSSSSRLPSSISMANNDRYNYDIPKTRSTVSTDVELSDNGPYSSLQIDTSTSFPDAYDASPSQSSSTGRANSKYFQITRNCGEIKPRSTVSTDLDLSDNGPFTSVRIDTSASFPDVYGTDPSQTNIKIVKNRRNSNECSSSSTIFNKSKFLKSAPVYHSDFESSGSSTETYTMPTVKSEIREVKHENPGPSTSKPSPLLLRRNRDKWYVCDESSGESTEL